MKKVVLFISLIVCICSCKDQTHNKQKSKKTVKKEIVSESDIVDDDTYEEDVEIDPVDEEDDLPEGLLYKGFYTISGQGRFESSGEYTYPGADMEVEISIYEDYLEILGDIIEFSGYNGSSRVYEGYMTGFKTRFIVSPPSYSMYRKTYMEGPYSCDWVITNMSKGSSTMPKHYSGSSNIDSDTPRQPYRQRCRACVKDPGTCSGCDGLGEIKYHYDSTTDRWLMRECNACNGTGVCNGCGGDGWVDEGEDF